MRINQVIIIPEFWRDGNLGKSFGKHNQYDALDAYITPFCEFLDHDRIAFRVQKPEEKIFPNSLVIQCGVGWTEKMQRANISAINYNQQESRSLSLIMQETLQEWGRVYVDLAHRMKEILPDKQNASLNEPQTIALRVTPFCLNGANSGEYCQRSNALGKLLAHTIYEFMKSRGEQPKMMSYYNTAYN